MNQFPNENIALYNYKNAYNIRAEALTLILEGNNKLASNGRKVAIMTDCEIPKKAALRQTVHTKYLDSVYPCIGGNFARDLSFASTSAITASGFVEMRLKDIFDEELNWWKKNSKL